MSQLLRNAMAWIERHGYRFWSNGIGYWLFTTPATDVPGDMGHYVGYLYPIDVLCLAGDLRDLDRDLEWEREQEEGWK